MRRLRPDTLAVHAGDHADPHTKALEPPIVLASAYAFDSADDAAAQFRGEAEGHIYTRWSNPTVRALEEKIAALEGAADAVALASGMAAVAASLESFLVAGDHVVASASMYAEAARLMRERLPRFGIETTFVDTTDLAAVRAAMRPRTRVLYVETPANPTLLISDLPALAEIAHAAGAKLVVDGTFATPYHQQPLALGADVVLHSATKSISGHGDTIGGVAAGAKDVVKAMREGGVRTAGAPMAPLTAMLVARGARTLCLRMERASASAAWLAEKLAADPRIEVVHYPGLPSHPQHALAKRQMQRGFGAMIAFEVKGGLPAGKRAYDRLELVARAVSLGDVRSLITHPASTTSASMPREDRIRGGITDGLMRMSVGIEDREDLWEDLSRALG
ncbi:MAG: PLP-dependent aspartate aminotransferase family protein [Sandaracinus sp.]